MRNEELVIRKNLPAVQTPDLGTFFEGIEHSKVSRDVREVKIEFSGEQLSLKIDPTTIGTIITVADFILSLFGGGDEHIGDWLSKISDQLNKVNQLLQQVLDLLADLKVYVHLAFVEDAEKDLLARADMYVQNLPHWKATLRSAATQQELRDALRDIQNSSRKCIEYGYGSYNLVGYALRYETDLLYLTRRNKETKKSVFKYYKEYFSNCNNPRVSQSVANIRQVSEQNMRELEARFPSRSNFKEGKGEITWQTGRRECTTDAFTIINGSLMTGFTGHADVEASRRCKVIDPSGRPDPSFLSKNDVNEALQPIRDQFNSFLNAANRASLQYRELVSHVDALKKAEEKVRALQSVAYSGGS